MRARLSLVTACLLAAPSLPACGGPDCSVAAPNWPKAMPPMLPDAQEPREEFSVEGSGRIRWRGFPGADRVVGLAELERLLPVMSELRPAPWLIVRVSAGADCASVRAVGAALERQRICAEGRCVEGAVWDRAFGR
ncbi:MAG TPA: hypothetical protein VEA61_05605 [Allosphingosinicella sp.]|nr:hypothetical protein [Allosphingosinicella sp.]